MSNPPAQSSSPSPDALARQVRRLQILLGILALALAGTVGGLLYARHLGQPVAILLDGKLVATARSAAAADAVLRAAEQAKVGGGYAANDIVRLQTVRLVPLTGGIPLEPDSAAQAKLAAALKLHVRAYAILVDGKPRLGLPTDEMAVETLHLVKEHFAQMPPPAQIIGEPEFVQNVTVQRMAITASQARSDPTQAAPLFWTAPPSHPYIVRRGDTGGRIAYRAHITLTDLIAANSGRDINRLKPGDTITVEKMPLLLAVRVKKQLTRDEKIVANAPDAEAGQRSVTYAVTFINGQETRRDAIGMVTRQAPRTQTSL